VRGLFDVAEPADVVALASALSSFHHHTEIGGSP
jgi:hypothetical protein